MGDVYAEPIANEHAVHSLEHGAVWVTYKQGLAADQVAKLQTKVEGKDYMLMSPVAGLDKNVSLQAWGYQLKVDNADDTRIDEFIKDLRVNASMEPGAACSSGNTDHRPGRASSRAGGTAADDRLDRRPAATPAVAPVTGPAGRPQPASATGWLAAVLVFGLLVGLGRRPARPPPAHPGDDSAEAGFLRDMSTHHAQAVEMSMIAHAELDQPRRSSPWPPTSP